ncbi:MAG: Rhs element Vgr protein, partial [Rhodocyclales bacterium]|nr:Rhs element Vgr protein [Rhodocyclales bacterium]
MDVSISHSIDASGIGAALPGRDVFMHALSQTARLLNIVTPLPDAALVVETMHGREALSAPYSFEIDCLSSSIHFELKRFIGEEVTLRVLLADGRSHRNWHGLVTAASQLGGDGGLARYRLVIEPWFAYLRPRRNSRIFQDKTAQDIVSEVFADYPTGSFEFALTDALPLRSYTAQYRESDFEFVVRILASEGLSYRFEHRQDGSAATTGAGQSTEELAHTRHKLVIFDAHSALPGCPQSLIRFHRSNATEASDSVQSWQTRQQLMTNTVTRASWDYKQLLSPAGSSRVMTEAFGGLGDFPELEDFHGGSAYRYADASQADRAAAFVTQYLALATQTHRITSSVRQLDAGQQFLIVGHPVLEGERARHTVLAIEHEAANNLDSNAKPLAGLLAGNGDDKPLERGTYRNTALCVVAALPVVPQPQRKPIVPGHHSAIVVGTANDAQGLGTHSDRDGRIKIQFPWQRGTAPIVGGLTHDTERATGDNANGTWVRVAESLAGPNWGSSFTPRVGSEVIVEFIEGDIDRPIVTQQMWNGEDTPPFAAGEGSNANHPGVIAGMHAPTLDGSGWGQWLVDDASGQLRTRLASSHTNSQLNLGYLIHGQGAASSHRGAYRGQGFELATDGWSILRATMG